MAGKKRVADEPTPEPTPEAAEIPTAPVEVRPEAPRRDGRPNPDANGVYRTKRRMDLGNGKVAEAGELVDLSHAPPGRIDKMLEQRWIFTAADWDATERSAEAARVRNELHARAAELGREISDKIAEAKQRIELKHLRAMADAQRVAESELLRDRDIRLRRLREETEAKTRELEAPR